MQECAYEDVSKADAHSAARTLGAFLNRIAGAYMDSDGYDNGTFNIHFGKLNLSDTKRYLDRFLELMEMV